MTELILILISFSVFFVVRFKSEIDLKEASKRSLLSKIVKVNLNHGF